MVSDTFKPIVPRTVFLAIITMATGLMCIALELETSMASWFLRTVFPATLLKYMVEDDHLQPLPDVYDL